MYGDGPTEVAAFPEVELDEFMTWLYLPVRWNTGDPSDVRLPYGLVPLRPLVDAVIADLDGASGKYIYLTAKHGFATPGNPLNRAGWHCDGFGTDDLNYVWWMGAGTRFLHYLRMFEDDRATLARRIPDDHVASLDVFETLADEAAADPGNRTWKIDTPASRRLYKLDPTIIHTTPEIPEPGEMRSFAKVSVSDHQYNLMGNNHNDRFEYRWRMWPRSTIRNDPARAQSDFFYPEGAAT